MPGLGARSNMASIKKPPRHIASLYMILATTLLVISIAGVGGAFLWKQYQISLQEKLKIELADREKQFNINLIEQLKQVNVQIDTARGLLREHRAVSAIFDLISKLTVEKIQFTTLEIVGPDNPGGDLNITLEGSGANLAVLAFQSDVLGSLERYNLRKAIKNPIISNPKIGADGLTSFILEASVDPSSVSYERIVTGDDTGSATSTSL